MKGLLIPVPDGRYEVRSFAVDEERHNVAAYGVFRGTHTGEGGPVPPTGKQVEADYVYVMQFDDDKNPPHDEDLERQHQSQATWMGVKRASSHWPGLVGCFRAHDHRHPGRQ